MTVSRSQKRKKKNNEFVNVGHAVQFINAETQHN